MKSTRLLLALVSVAFFAAACSKSDSHDHDKKSAHAGHARKAPHGGTLVEIGDHQFNLEFVLDAATGKISAYILDAHAENFVRSALPSFQAVATVGTEKRTLTFMPVAYAATGETVGDTSQFDATADWLKTTPTFTGEIDSINIRGAVFKDIDFAFPAGTAAGHAEHAGHKH